MKRNLRLFTLIVVLVILATGCTAPPAAPDTSELEAQVADLQAQLEAASDDEAMAELEAQIADLQTQLDAAEEAAAAAAEAAAAEEAAPEPVTLTMAIWDQETTPYWQVLADAYQAQNPNVTIELLDTASAEYIDKVNVMLSGGDETDIITIKDIPQYSGLLERGQIVPLTSLIADAGIDTSVYSGAVEELTYEGEVYALPFRSDIWILYYNKDVFDAAGLDYPANDITWDEFDQLAREVTSGSGADKIYGAHFHTWRSCVQLGTVQDGLNTVISDDYSFMKPMYDMVIGMQQDGIIMDYGELRAGSIHYRGVFENGQIAMLPMGSWLIGTLIDAKATGEMDFEWGIGQYPHPDGVEAGTTAGTLTSLAINSNSKNKEAAWDFIQFYTGIEGAKVLAGTGNLPAIRTPEVLDVFASVEGMPEGTKEALQTTTVRLELPMDPNVSVVEQILNEEHELIMTGSVSVDQGIEEMTTRINEALSE